MRFRFGWFSLMAVLAPMLGGCQQEWYSSSSGGIESAVNQPIDVYQLANHLGMRVVESGSSRAVLENGPDRVSVFANPGGRVYVNSKTIWASASVSTANGRIFVSRSLEQQIRSELGRPAVPRVSSRDSPSRNRKGQLVVLDPGHGGKDPGAISPWGYYEKTVNLAVAEEAAAQLRKEGWEVRLTRDTDRFVELEERARLANRLRSEVFVSIHSDYSDNQSAEGFTVYVERSAPGSSKSLAENMVRAMSETGLPSRGLQRADYRVLVHCSRPAVLVELGYLSNRREAKLLRDRSFQRRLGRAIAKGITTYLD